MQEVEKLYLLVHPNWLNVLIESEKYVSEPALRQLYEKNKPALKKETPIDWNRYRKEMFARYSELIRKASGEKAVVVIVTYPMNTNTYRKILEKNPKSIQKNWQRNVARLIKYGKEILGKRFIVLNMGTLEASATQAVMRISKILERRGFALSKNFTLIAAGEISKACVSMMLKEAKWLLKPRSAKMPMRYCGDVLEGVKARRIRRHTFR